MASFISVNYLNGSTEDVSLETREPLCKVISNAREAYYNTDEPVISDDEFDRLIEALIAISPYNDTFVKKVGTLPARGRHTILPYYVGSLDKVKTEKAFMNFMSKWSDNTMFCITPKYDGVSCVIKFDENGEFIAYKRGTGVVGSDITKALKFVKLPKAKSCILRGELVINVDKWDVENPRNYVNGKVSKLEPEEEEILDVIEFVSYEMIKSIRMPQKSIDVQFASKMLKSKHLFLSKAKCTYDHCLEHLKKVQTTYGYPCDGLVIRAFGEFELPTSSNPSYSTAFKPAECCNRVHVQTVVTDIEWNAGKSGTYKPTVLFEPVVIDGATISRASGKNYRWIVANGVGIGAKIEVERSGGVIPNISSIIEVSKVPLQLPEDSIHDSSGVDLVQFLDKTKTIASRLLREVTALNLRSYINATSLKGSFITRLESIHDLLDPVNLKHIGIKPATIKAIGKAVDSIYGNSDITLLFPALVASGVAGVGLGLVNLQAIYDNIPEYFTGTKIGDKTVIPGFGVKKKKVAIENQAAIVEYIDAFSRKPTWL